MLDSASDCSDDGELSDHDLTPCNPSPSFPVHGWAALSGAGRGSGACMDHDDIEEDWRNHVQNVTNDPTNETLLSTFVAFGKLFNVRSVCMKHIRSVLIAEIKNAAQDNICPN